MTSLFAPPGLLGNAGLSQQTMYAYNRNLDLLCDYFELPLNSKGERRSEEHTSELQSLMRISYAVFCLQKKKTTYKRHTISKSQPQEVGQTRMKANTTHN